MLLFIYLFLIKLPRESAFKTQLYKPTYRIQECTDWIDGPTQGLNQQVPQRIKRKPKSPLSAAPYPNSPKQPPFPQIPHTSKGIKRNMTPGGTVAQAARLQLLSNTQDQGLTGTQVWVTSQIHPLPLAPWHYFHCPASKKDLKRPK